MVNVNDFKTGMSIKYEGNIYSVVDYQHVKPGKGAAFVKAKLKNLRTGAIIEITFNSSVKVELAHIEKRDMQFLYSQGDTYYFMNMETYDQIEVKESQLGDDKKYLKENLVLNIISYEGEILGLQLPDKIEMVVTKTEPGVKGNTTNNAMKDAVLETGMTVKVPLFINEGETIIVSTKDGKYQSRA
ncbi:MAG TPA: elongation factor P [Candidatus Faecenecus gallistercoris]|uniref:Elongation factor P n=1 Tax=Candidatus Faecenecus gallistercoris TaxID=2840793 RepID=A0A9D0YZL6_9FIRM|nr:elongation factor P [Bacillota bacterium]MDY4051312.1 elongation factor P [Candidatus Faecenecus gallistercoris]PWL73594.1 MAG: elongation factor P [Bacillota bacterium]HIQ64780.1 elongation factor P [Candidatus Faecenecus gallistercoris]